MYNNVYQEKIEMCVQRLRSLIIEGKCRLERSVHRAFFEGRYLSNIIRVRISDCGPYIQINENMFSITSEQARIILVEIEQKNKDDYAARKLPKLNDCLKLLKLEESV